MFGKRSLFNHLVLRVAVISLLGQSFIAQAAPPAWWSQGNPPVIDPIASPDNHGMANIGQAKWMAQSALDELGKVLGIDSPTVEAIRLELFKANENSSQGVFFPGRPENPSQVWLANQKAPLEIGALKALAAPFYKHLSVLDGPWVEARLRDNGLLTLGTDYYQDVDGTFFPWNPAHDHTTERNHAAATVGQLKLVFSLDFGGDFETGEFTDGISDLREAAFVDANDFDEWVSISQINASTIAAAGGGYPAPTDAQTATPLAHIEQQVIDSGRYLVDYHDAETPNLLSAWAFHPGGILWGEGEASGLRTASSYSAFMTAVDQLQFDANDWHPLTIFGGYQINGHDPTSLQTWDIYGYDRARFRLKLDAPAPVGGYKIPLRIGIARRTSSDTFFHAGNPAYAEIMLECLEGQTEGIPVNFSPPVALGANERVIFIPISVSISTSELGAAWTIPSDGTCVTSDETILLDCGNSGLSAPIDGDGAPLEVFWKMRQLKGDGTFKDAGTLLEWKIIYDPTHFDPADPLRPLPLKGPHETVSSMNGGIYQLKAMVVLPDSTIIEFPFVRMRNGRSIVDSAGHENALLVAGQPDYFGVCENPLSKSVRNAAVTWLGATGYREGANVPVEPGSFFNTSTVGSPKCNLFVTHISNSVGATTPYFNRKRFGILTPQHSAPIAKYDWYQNPEENIDIDPDGWNFLADAAFPSTNPTVKDFTTELGSLRSWHGGPCPGMAIASPRTKAGPTYGHVGILDYDGSWINAGAARVTKCLHLLDVLPDYKPNNFRSR